MAHLFRLALISSLCQVGSCLHSSAVSRIRQEDVDSDLDTSAIVIDKYVSQAFSAGTGNRKLFVQGKQTRSVERQLIGETSEDSKGIAPYWFGISFHKTGTWLSRELMRIFAEEKGLEYSILNTKGVPKKGKRVQAMSNPIFEDVRKIDKAFPDYRLVVFVRNPMAMVTSGYLYHKRSSDDSSDCYNNHATGQNESPQILASKSLEDGLKFEMDCSMKKELKIMNAWMRNIRDYGSNNTLLLSLDMFQSDFDNTVERMYSHLMRDSAPADLLEKAKELDVNRWSAEKVEHETHVSLKEESESAARAFRQLVDGDKVSAAFKDLVHLYEEMGFKA